jgi:hypothetical protein
MTAGLQRDRLPDPAVFFEAQGLALVGRGPWVTTRCEFHGGGDSMRVHRASGAWVCMACGVKGGDVIAYVMQRDGLDFVQAAKALGAWADGPGAAAARPRSFSARDALSVLSFEIYIVCLVIGDARRGTLPSDRDWARFLEAAGRIQLIADEARR